MADVQQDERVARRDARPPARVLGALAVVAIVFVAGATALIHLRRSTAGWPGPSGVHVVRVVAWPSSVGGYTLDVEYTNQVVDGCIKTATWVDQDATGGWRVGDSGTAHGELVMSGCPLPPLADRTLGTVDRDPVGSVIVVNGADVTVTSG